MVCDQGLFYIPKLYSVYITCAISYRGFWVNRAYWGTRDFLINLNPTFDFTFANEVSKCIYNAVKRFTAAKKGAYNILRVQTMFFVVYEIQFFIYY